MVELNMEGWMLGQGEGGRWVLGSLKSRNLPDYDIIGPRLQYIYFVHRGCELEESNTPSYQWRFGVGRRSSLVVN